MATLDKEIEILMLKGQKGDTGSSISRIEKTATSGKVDTYTIYLTDGTTTTFQVTNGEVTLEQFRTIVSEIEDFYDQIDDEVDSKVDITKTSGNYRTDITNNGNYISFKTTNTTNNAYIEFKIENSGITVDNNSTTYNLITLLSQIATNTSNIATNTSDISTIRTLLNQLKHNGYNDTQYDESYDNYIRNNTNNIEFISQRTDDDDGSGSRVRVVIECDYVYIYFETREDEDSDWEEIYYYQFADGWFDFGVNNGTQSSITPERINKIDKLIPETSLTIDTTNNRFYITKSGLYEITMSNSSNTKERYTALLSVDDIEYLKTLDSGTAGNYYYKTTANNKEVYAYYSFGSSMSELKTQIRADSSMPIVSAKLLIEY